MRSHIIEEKREKFESVKIAAGHLRGILHFQAVICIEIAIEIDLAKVAFIRSAY